MSHIPGAVPPARRRRLAPLLLIAGVAGAVVLSLSMTNTFSAFTAAINNTTDTSASGTVILKEVSGGTTCLSTDNVPAGNTINSNSSNCTGINKYGGSVVMVPSNTTGSIISTSAPVTSNTTVTTVTLTNTGSAPATAFTLKPGVCTQSNNGAINGSASGATGICSKLDVSVAVAGTVVANGTALGIASTTINLASTGPLAAGASVVYTFTVWLDATADNTYQGLAASQPLLWTLST